MSIQNEKWINILNLAKVEETSKDLFLGSLENVKVNEVKNEYRLILSFPTLVDAQTLFDAFSKVSDYLISECGISNVKYSVLPINAKSYNKSFIYDYFVKAIEIWSNDIATVKILYKYKTEIDENGFNNIT